MKKSFLYKASLVAALAISASACTEDAVIGQVDTGVLDVPEGSLVYITDAAGSTGTSLMEYRNNGSLDLFASVTKNQPSQTQVHFVYDSSVLTAYNEEHGTEFEAIPESQITLSNGGLAVIEAGQTKSDAMTLGITSDGNLNHEITYVIPLRIESTGLNMASSSTTRIVFAKDLSSLPDCDKWVTNADGETVPGIKIFAVLEVNDTNPLNVLRYRLKNTGKYMVDAMVIFSGNINYDAENNKVYFFPNENVSAIINNYDKYLKPLKDRGMKIIMGVMCNHDRACIANLSDESAKVFAKELDALCNAYHLDGLFWDDEYCSPLDPPTPGFVHRSTAAWSRLAYEYWKTNTERWNVAYGYSTTSGATAVDGVQPGEFITYVLPDYGYGMPDYSSAFEGMPVNHWGAYSCEFALGKYKNESQFRQMRKEGRGAIMMFAQDPNRKTCTSQDATYRSMAKIFYDDEVVIDEDCIYAKDW